MKRKSIFEVSRICGIALCLLYFIGCSLSAAAQDASRTTARVVSEQRVQELKDLRWGMFICWSFSTFSGREWTGDVAKRTDYDKLFPAKKVDTDQWAKTAKEAGMGYILFLTKHHDGFCLWDTKTTERKVTNAPLGKDVLRALKKSCDKYGIKLALYFSEGDWTWDGAIDGKHFSGGNNPETKKAQLRELLTGYGQIEYIWFDHAAGTGGLSHEETTAWCKQFQPDCFVGYNHGDQSTADIRLGEMGKPGPLEDVAAAGPHLNMKDGKHNWRLAEFTYPILSPHEGGAMWFYSLPKHDELVHPASKLFDDYLGAVKYGNIFSIDVGPDYNGKLRDIDVKTLREVGKLIRKQKNAQQPASSAIQHCNNSAVDWQTFLAKQDPVWEKLPQQFDHGAFLGNGLLGTTIFQDGQQQIRFEMGRSDVTDHRRDNGRLPIGGLLLKTAGQIQSGKLRTDLWNAEALGEIVTDKGTIRFRAINHAEEIALIADFAFEGEEKDAVFQWEPKDAAVFRDEVKKANIEANPQPESGREGDLNYCEQKRVAGGSYTTAWRLDSDDSGKRRLTLTIADAFPDADSRRKALETVERVAKIPASTLEKSHRKWWHGYYPASFVSVPDSQIEGFYWNQIYKLASATRRERMVIDLLGPWYRSTGWPRIWWNLNIQIAYSPVYTANRLELGESFTRFIDAKRDNFVKNAKDIWNFDDCATVPHTTDYEGLRGDGTCAPDSYINPGDFTWALHLYWQQYRFSMDESLVAGHATHAFYPLLKQSVNLYLKLLKKGDDGKLHLPKMHSPEYGDDEDNNYNLSLLRWACETLLYLDARYKFNDSSRPEWERVLTELVEYPQDENGLRIGRNVPFEHSHRHWSHILMVWPLHILSTEQSANRELVEKSVKHWLTVENAKGINGWALAAASAIYSYLGDGDNALRCLRAHHNDKRFVMPNTQYIEGSPVIECSLVAAESLQEMLIQSWGDVIRIFPAVPAEWKDASFQDLRAEGAFLVTAVRKDGKTKWVRIKSLAGEPCRVKPNFGGGFRLSSDSPVTSREVSAGVFELNLKRGQEVLLYQDDSSLETAVAPVMIPQEKTNFWGVK